MDTGGFGESDTAAIFTRKSVTAKILLGTKN